MEASVKDWNNKMNQAILDADFPLFDQLLIDRKAWIDTLEDKEKKEALQFFIDADRKVGILVKSRMDELKSLLVHQNNQRKVFHKYDKY